jgi:hypothetical protein
MTHLTRDDFVDALDGALDGTRRAHLDSCVACRRELASLAAVLGDTRRVQAPEPSPLFWDHFSARVRDAVARDEPRHSAWMPSAWSWRMLAPLAALALVILALVWAMPRPPAPADDRMATTTSPASDIGLSAMVQDDGWQLVAELVSTVDWDTAAEAGLGVPPGAAERAVMDLTVEEQQELRRLLTAELARSKS